MENKLSKMGALGGLAMVLTAAILKSPVKPAQVTSVNSKYSPVAAAMPADSAFVLNGPTLLYRVLPVTIASPGSNNIRGIGGKPAPLAYKVAGAKGPVP